MYQERPDPLLSSATTYITYTCFVTDNDFCLPAISQLILLKPNVKNNTRKGKGNAKTQNKKGKKIAQKKNTRKGKKRKRWKRLRWKPL